MPVRPVRPALPSSAVIALLGSLQGIMPSSCCWGSQDGYPGLGGPSVTPRVPNTTPSLPCPCTLANSGVPEDTISCWLADVGQALTLVNGIFLKA